MPCFTSLSVGQLKKQHIQKMNVPEIIILDISGNTLKDKQKMKR